MKELVTVEIGINPHSHIREAEEKMRKHLSLILDGGIECILAMPNTQKGLRTFNDVLEYTRYAASVRPDKNFDFIPCAMLTELTTVQDIELWAAAGIMDAKVYPRFRTTNSESGVVQYAKLLPLVARCGELGIRVHFHPEHPSKIYTSRDAEYAFISLVLMFLEATSAVIVWEHGTDARCIPFWEDFATRFPDRFYVTITAHHLATNEDLAFGNVREVCKPPAKTEADRLALIAFVAKGYEWVIAGADDAPHDQGKNMSMRDSVPAAATQRRI
jgi:dihydroorotase